MPMIIALLVKNLQGPETSRIHISQCQAKPAVSILFVDIAKLTRTDESSKIFI